MAGQPLDPDRFRELDGLLQSALQLCPARREVFLRELSGSDPGLERELRSLLELEHQAGNFLERPAVEAAGYQTDSLIGRRVSHYHVVERIGGGGMGVVYKAEDARLGRPVALKFVSDELSRDPEALDRFAREARTASALNHPNICTIHDIGEQDGRSFIVMEYLEGTTLKDRLADGSLNLNTVLDVGTQIADALDAAHTAGIIHRDIKPANIFIGSRDRVKVLDFGLATMRVPASHEADVTAIAGTGQGVVMGTAAYMAREQAGGEMIDHRADLWSLGVVLCEMLTGTRPAPGVRLVDAAPELERLISKCLNTDRELRYQQAADLRSDLEHLKRGSDSAQTVSGQLSRKARTHWRRVAAGAAGIALIAAGYAWDPRAPTLTDRDTIVLADFTNTTGDPVFDETLRQGLAVQLQQSPFLSLISDQRIRRTLPLMNQPADARVTPEVALGVCARTASAAVLEGSIAALGGQYIIGLRAKNCASGDILADEQAQAARKEEVLSTLSRIVTRVRTQLGESLATIEKHSTPLEEATTSSLEALQAYSAGWKVLMSSGSWVRGLPLFHRAIAIDPEFAMGHAQVGFGYSVMGESALARPSLLRAYQLRDRASDVERFFIETLYDRDFTGNLERERRTLELWAESYPRDARPHGLISGLALSSTGQYELAIAEADKAIALDPDLTPAYGNKSFNQLSLNRLDDALLTVGRATERQLSFVDLLLIQYFVAFLNSNEDELRRTATMARKNPYTEDLISHVEALALARSGRLQEARRMGAVPIEIALRAGQRERAGLFEAGRAVWEAFYGNAAAARQSASTALALGRGRDVDYAAAFALALSGDLPRSRAIAEDLAREYPEDTSVQFMYLPTLRAMFSMNAHDAAGAIQTLQIASRYDLALGGVGFIGRFGGLYPIYVRGQAYLAAQYPAAAAAEFQRLLDHRSIVLVDPMDAMARLQLARALTRSGDTVKAKSAYRDLLALWEDADPKVPIVEQARAEYARLP
jgi:serine/threonine protein kinase/tetratricopeptide (TPR) repeat protein